MLRTLSLASAAILLAATVVSAQGVPPPGPGGPGAPGQPAAGPPPPVVVQQALGLSDDQVAALHALLDARRLAMEQLEPQIRDTERALHDAIHSPDPDPAAVGALVLQLEALRAQVNAAGEAFRNGFLDILDDEQHRRLEHAFATERALAAARALHALGL